MVFLAGLDIAWTVVILLMGAAMGLAYLRFGRNREYLACGLGCLVLTLHFAPKAALYVAQSSEEALLPMRLVMGAFPATTGVLFYLGLNRYSPSHGARRDVLFAIIGVTVALVAACVAGVGIDQTMPMALRFVIPLPAATWEGVLHLYRLTFLGYALIVLSLVVASGAGVLLAIAATRANDRLAQTFFFAGVVITSFAMVHDVLMVAGVIQSVFLLEHVVFLLCVCVMMGFLWEFEVSREALEASDSALKQTAQRLNRAADESRRLRPMADLGRLSASLAHEIRNPLAVLSNVACSLQRFSTRVPEAEDIQGLVGMLQEEIGGLARLVDDLLLFSHAGRITRTPLQPAALVDLATCEVGQLSDAEGVKIVTQVEPGLPQISGSMRTLRRALANLILNAVQSAEHNGTVHVTACLSRERPNVVSIGVKDDAGGIKEDDLPEIFEPFFSTRRTGTGLGLPIARSIVEAHQGSLVLENTPGQGARFCMNLPAT